MVVTHGVLGMLSMLSLDVNDGRRRRRPLSALRVLLVAQRRSAAPRAAVVGVLDVVLVAHLLDLLLGLLLRFGRKLLLLLGKQVDLGVLALQGRSEANLLDTNGAQNVWSLAVVCACQLYS